MDGNGYRIGYDSVPYCPDHPPEILSLIAGIDEFK
jgi:hypothetical protein